MKDKERLYSTVSQLLPLLREHGYSQWARQLEGYAAEYEDDPLHAKHCIRGLFGGNGALNDVVLQTETGQRIVPDDDIFHELLDELWEVCQAMV